MFTLKRHRSFSGVFPDSHRPAHRKPLRRQQKHIWYLAAAIVATVIILAIIVPVAVVFTRENEGIGAPSPPANMSIVNHTADNSNLKTWWHDAGVNNSGNGILPYQVRQSGDYMVQVSTASDPSGVFYDSFVYESIPRNGNGNILMWNNQTSVTNASDGITIEAGIGLTMAWSQFLYSEDVVLRIQRSLGPQQLKNVGLRPVRQNLNVSEVDGDILVTVPYSETGQIFSVEFVDNLYTFMAGCTNTSTDFGADCGYVQNEDPAIGWYTGLYTDNNAILGTEPLNSLLIFASPFPPPDLVPNPNQTSTQVLTPGMVTTNDLGDAETLVFNPGIYSFGGEAHAKLHSNTTWVYLAPGAYVKGALEFTTNATSMTISGSGVLSGEEYVYQANTALNYTNVKSDDSSLRMISGYSVWNNQSALTIDGITVASPPFNSMDFRGDLNTLSVYANDYKQVGAFFAQTDGLEMYPGSRATNIFYHSNDDTIKTYYSNVTVENVIVWKANTAPVIQFGWASRSMSNVTVNNVSVIHTRWSSNTSHPGIIGSNQIYGLPETSTNTANLSNTISNVTYSNIDVNGPTGNLFRICPLSNLENFQIVNVTLLSYVNNSTGQSVSELVPFTDWTGKSISVSEFVIENYFIGKIPITEFNDDWNTTRLGNLNLPAAWMESNNVTVR